MCVPCSTVPAVKEVLDKCTPNYVQLPFATTGFDGVTTGRGSTDEEDARQAKLETQTRGGAGSSGNSQKKGSGRRVCRQSKRWAACSA